MNRGFVFICTLLLPAFLAFQTTNPAAQPDGYRQPSPAALAYFEKAFSHIKENAFFHTHLDFAQVKRQALAMINNAQSYADTYDAIRFVLTQLNDRHSFFRPPSANGENAFNRSMKNNQVIPFEASILEGQYGILTLKSYNSVNAINSHRISDSLYNCLAEFSRKKVKGIIVDLRIMEGGTYIPFLTGLAPLIDADQLIGFVDRKGKRTQTVRYKNAIYYKVGRKTSRLGYLSNYAPLPLADLPVAVLSGKYTASAGEMLLIAFIGLPGVKIFGSPTYGVPTGKANLFLADSAMISLTNTACFDRQKVAYTSSIQPDVPCPEEEAATLAKHWISTR